MFLTVVVTARLAPRPVSAGAVTVVTTRSGPMTMGAVCTPTSLVASASCTTPLAFTLAFTRYRPGRVEAGMVTSFVSDAVVRPLSDASGASPRIWSFVTTGVVSLDRNHRTTVAGARPGVAARFFTTVVTLMLAPGALTAGAVTDWTTRSGRT